VSAAELQGWMAVAAQPPAGGKRERGKMEKKSAEKRASMRISKHAKETTQERDRGKGERGESVRARVIQSQKKRTSPRRKKVCARGCAHERIEGTREGARVCV